MKHGQKNIKLSSGMISLKVTAWYAGQEGTAIPSWPAYQAVTYIDQSYQMMY